MFKTINIADMFRFPRNNDLYTYLARNTHNTTQINERKLLCIVCMILVIKIFFKQILNNPLRMATDIIGV